MGKREKYVISFTLPNGSRMDFPPASRPAAQALYNALLHMQSDGATAGTGFKVESLHISDKRLPGNLACRDKGAWTAAVMAGETSLGLAQWAEAI